MPDRAQRLVAARIDARPAFPRLAADLELPATATPRVREVGQPPAESAFLSKPTNPLRIGRAARSAASRHLPERWDGLE